MICVPWQIQFQAADRLDFERRMAAFGFVPVYQAPWMCTEWYDRRWRAPWVRWYLRARDAVYRGWARHCAELRLVDEGCRPPWPSWLEHGWNCPPTFLFEEDTLQVWLLRQRVVRL